MEEETVKARGDVAALAKEIHNINYVISSIDTKIETKKNERHNLFIQCKVIFFNFSKYIFFAYFYYFIDGRY